MDTKKDRRFIDVVIAVFGLDENGEIENLEYQGIKQWDSLGHMALMAALEDEFAVELEIDDIVDFSSVQVGREILSKYDLK